MNKEWENLPPEQKRWLMLTSTKIVAACQMNVMMGYPQDDRFIGGDTFRRT